jgi:glycosyltransferase involved in cell wall biosynthesis
MAQSPLISVIIATYNRSGFLRETVESVLAQNFHNFEVIVVDDGSTDDTRAVMEAYGSRVRYFFRENRGPSAARNFGVAQARAPWIAFQDSDDLSLPDHLSALYDYVRQRPDCGMVFANGGYIDTKQERRATIIPADVSRRLAANGVTLPDLFDKSMVRLQASLIARSRYDAVGGHDESLCIAMDLDLSFRLFMTAPVAYLDRVVFLYRRHAGNIGRNEELRLTENIRVIEKLLADFPSARALLGNKKIDRRLAYRSYRLAKHRWRAGDKARAQTALASAVSLRPLFWKYRMYGWLWSGQASAAAAKIAPPASPRDGG